jgi:hypothetical protein
MRSENKKEWYNLRNTINCFAFCYARDRFIEITHSLTNTKYFCGVLKAGLSQDSILGPLPFTIFIDDISKNFNLILIFLMMKIDNILYVFNENLKIEV